MAAHTIYSVFSADIAFRYTILLPIPLQNLAFHIQSVFFRGFDGMQLPSLCQVVDILPGAPKELSRLGHIDNPIHNKVPKIRDGQWNLFCQFGTEVHRTH